MNRNKTVCILCFITGAISTFIALFWFKVFPKGTQLDLSALVTLLGIILGVISVMWSTNKQIKNQNKENNKPYVIIQSSKEELVFIESSNINKINHAKEIGEAIAKKSIHVKKQAENYGFDENHYEVKIKLQLKNIGYGTAYNLQLQDVDDKLLIGGFSLARPYEKQSYALKKYLEKDDDCESIITICGSGINTNVGLDTADKIYISLIFTDLNSNIYLNLIEIMLFQSGEVFIESFSYESYEFRYIVKQLNIDYKKLLKRYRKSIYGGHK